MYLGIDLGTSGVKTLLIDADQKILTEAQASLSVLRPHDGWSEQEPKDWIDAVDRSIRAIAAEHDLSGVKGIGLSGQMHGATVLDRDHKVLRPAILWNDTRAAHEARSLDDTPVFRQESGNIVFAGFTAPKLLWMKHHEPALFDRVAMVLLPKDYVRLWLTGDCVSEMSDAAGTSWLNTAKRDWSDALLAATDLSRNQMPRLVEGSEPSGNLRSKLARDWGLPEGVIVAGGAGDNAATAIGTGITQQGDGFLSLGTSGVIFTACEGYAPDAASAVHTFCHAVPETWHQMAVILAATDALNWFAKFMGSSPAALTANLKQLKAPSKTLFLPYLGGERTPLNNAEIRGGLFGLEHSTDMNAVAVAVLEGVGYALRDGFEALTKTGGRVDSLVAVGGGSQSRFWLKAIATILNTPIAVPANSASGAAFGAARLGQMAAENCGLEIAGKPEIAATLEPESDLKQAFDEGYQRFKSMQQKLLAG